MEWIFDSVDSGILRIYSGIVNIFIWIKGIIRRIKGLPRYSHLPVWVGKEKEYLKIYTNDKKS